MTDNIQHDATPPTFPPFPPATYAFHKRLLGLSGVTLVAAITGGMKSMLLLNLVVAAHMAGHAVLFLNLQMHMNMVGRRLRAILLNHPMRDIGSAPSLPHVTGLHSLDISSPPPTFADASTTLRAAVQSTGARYVFVDGPESLYDTPYNDVADFMSQLDDIARSLDVRIFVSAQLNRGGWGKEVVSLQDIAQSFTKAQISTNVVALGPRVPGELMTCCLLKQRDCSSDSDHARSVYRLMLCSSMRLEVLDYTKPVIRNLPDRAEPLYVGCKPADFPLSHEGQSFDDEGDDAAAGLSGIMVSPSEPMKPFHGSRGFVPVGRQVFDTPMFRDLKGHDFHWLMDLFQMAQFEDSRVYAPGTSTAVDLKRGEVLVSLRMLTKRWGQKSTKPIQRFLRSAEQQGLLTTRNYFSSLPAFGSGKTGSGTTPDSGKKALCTIINLCHYHLNEPAREPKQAA